MRYVQGILCVWVCVVWVCVVCVSVCGCVWVCVVWVCVVVCVCVCVCVSCACVFHITGVNYVVITNFIDCPSVLLVTAVYLVPG